MCLIPAFRRQEGERLTGGRPSLVCICVCVYVCGKVGAWDGRSIGSVKPELQPPDVSVGG